ncbi:hypothetical protein CRYUN_Cryun18bG0038700 [Craigia yunnanensis]
MPLGAVTLDDVDLDQVSVGYVPSCIKKGGMLELSEAIRDYHDHRGLPQMNTGGSAGEFFLVTNPEFSGITEDDLRETAYEILLACAGTSGGLIVPSKEKKKDIHSKLMKKLGRSRNENIMVK